MRSLFMLVILLIPFSTVYGYEKYETIPDFYLDSDPTICFSASNEGEYSSGLIKTAINNWNNELKNYTNNHDDWNIHYWFLDETIIPWPVRSNSM